ncbi:MAG: hypothetical protein BZ151_08895 [Desulfobacca sp. 4484_104]|nr:MAG: hypothetical protein BZ151_08895 [Desulfobacca sp. 4484_104]
MTPKISVVIDAQGQIRADFIAFPGRTCEGAEQRLRQELARWGVAVQGRVTPKSETQIAQELSQDQQPRGQTWKKLQI